MKMKKGTMLDLIFILPLILIIFVAGLVGMKAYNSFFESSNSSMNAQTRTITTSAGGVFTNMDYILTIMIFGMFLAVIISAIFIESHPMFFFASLLLLVITVFIAAPFANAYLSIKDEGTLSTEIASLSMSGYMLEYLPILVGVIGTIVIVVLYMKISGGRGSNV